MYIELIKVYRGDKDMQRNNPFTSSKQHDIAGDTIRSAFSLCGFFLSRNSSHQVENNIQSMVVERYTIFFFVQEIVNHTNTSYYASVTTSGQRR